MPPSVPTRLRLFQVLLSEALILAGCGGLLGLALGYWALRTIPAVLTTSLPGVSTVALDWRVLTFTSVLSLGSAALFALVPLAAGLRRDLHDLLREGSRATGGRRQHRVQAGLVVTSVAFAFMLLVCAGLFIRSFTKLVTVPSGLGTTNVLSLQVAVGLAVGAAGAISATRLLRATLFETNVYDPLTFATVPLVLAAVALAAAYLPARRAAAVDPIAALRD